MCIVAINLVSICRIFFVKKMTNILSILPKQLTLTNNSCIIVMTAGIVGHCVEGTVEKRSFISMAVYIIYVNGKS